MRHFAYKMVALETLPGFRLASLQIAPIETAVL